VARGWAAGTDEATQNEIHGGVTYVKTAALEELAPGTGCYMNEADRLDPEYLKDFYGKSLENLRVVKEKYDPEGVLYCPTCVGSDEWCEDESGSCAPCPSLEILNKDGEVL